MLSDYTTIKDLGLYDVITPSGIAPDGDINLESLAYDQEWYIQRGFSRERVELSHIVDQSYREAALQRIGRDVPRP